MGGWHGRGGLATALWAGLAAGLGAGLGAGAGASTLPPVAGLTIFGDSLSDPGNAAALAAAAGVPFPPEFPLGKASDGALWSEVVLQGFDDAGLPARNFAFAAGRIGAPGDPTPGNLTFQIGAFATQTPLPVGADEAALFWLGANDMRDALDTVLAGGVADPVAFLGAAADAAVGSLLQQAGAVAAAGFGQLVFVNLPDLSRIPATLALVAQREAAGQPAAAQQAALLAAGATAAFNTALVQGLAGPALAGVPTTVFDLNAAFVATLDAGLPGVTQPVGLPCLTVLGAAPTVPGSCGTFFFYDDIHPTSALHAALAAEIGAVVRPTAQLGVIPLPASGWLLLAGLAGLGLMARRRRV
ncbi:MAG: VPLPA-CTERM sorting domain-containing protein [Alkalilacustris sp.]